MNFLLFAGFNRNASTGQDVHPHMALQLGPPPSQESEPLLAPLEENTRQRKGAVNRKRLRLLYEVLQKHSPSKDKSKYLSDQDLMPIPDYESARSDRTPRVLLGDLSTQDKSSRQESLKENRLPSQEPQQSNLAPSEDLTAEPGARGARLSREEEGRGLNFYVEDKQLQRYMNVGLVSPSPPTAEDALATAEKEEKFIQPLSIPQLSDLHDLQRRKGILHTYSQSVYVNILHAF